MIEMTSVNKRDKTLLRPDFILTTFLIVRSKVNYISLGNLMAAMGRNRH